LEVVEGVGVIGEWEDVIRLRMYADSRGWEGGEWVAGGEGLAEAKRGLEAAVRQNTCG
jgi:hypothetical protein